MIDVLIIVGILAMFLGIVWYLRKEKKQGHTCIGCPNSRTCGSCGKSCH